MGGSFTNERASQESSEMSNNRDTKEILVVGAARNCADRIKADILKLQFSLIDFNRVHWLVIESDSEDNTLIKLNELAAEIENFRYVTLGSLAEKIKSRTERIAHCRNAYLKELQENPLYQDVEFVIVADLDGINTLISREAIASCFVRDDWAVCTANQQGPYYDIWALRHKIWCPNDCRQQVRFFQQHGLSKEVAKTYGISSKMLFIQPDTPWIEVDSAFGGLAIYQRYALENAHYVGLLEDGTEICEHVTLHKQIKDRGYKLFINPAFINAGFTDHTIHMKHIERSKLSKRINKFFKQIFKKNR